MLTQPKIGEDNQLTISAVKQEFGHIELTEHEKACALLDAYKRKAILIQEKEKNDAKEKRIAELMRMWSYDECYDFALQRGKDIGEQRGFDFQIDDINEHVFHVLALYFSNDPRFEKESYFNKPYSLKKGICLLSPVRGNGKTTMLDCFMYNKRGCYTKQSTKRMALDYEEYGFEAVKRFMWLLPISSSATNFYQNTAGVHYDDFGDEEEIMHMGNRRKISSMIINSIYDHHRDENQFHRFHISMNYKWSEYELKYGSNSASRMEEMFNLIPVPGESRRK